jgi:hypothetical protein
MNDQIAHQAQSALGVGPLRAFMPVAYFDSHAGCIRIELRDCSFTEERISQPVTLLKDNHPRP